jgi:hypothetical protein
MKIYECLGRWLTSCVHTTYRQGTLPTACIGHIYAQSWHGGRLDVFGAPITLIYCCCRQSSVGKCPRDTLNGPTSSCVLLCSVNVAQIVAWQELERVRRSPHFDSLSRSFEPQLSCTSVTVLLAPTNIFEVSRLPTPPCPQISPRGSQIPGSVVPACSRQTLTA